MRLVSFLWDMGKPVATPGLHHQCANSLDPDQFQSCKDYKETADNSHKSIILFVGQMQTA